MNNLFNTEKEKFSEKYRPRKISEIYGHNDIKNALVSMKNNNKILNFILQGPSGIGKTTIANVIAKEFNYHLIYLNAIKMSKDELFDSFVKAKKSLTPTILFIDEIHRLNKMQQDYLLEDLEKSNFIIIGATTENVYKVLNKALLSRMMVYKLQRLNDLEIKSILIDILNKENAKISLDILEYLVNISNGDARIAINNLEFILLQNLEFQDIDVIKKYIVNNIVNDKSDYTSALIKSIRGSDVDSAIYWLAALLEIDVDVEYIARRLVISASEDIGLANPQALVLANSCMQSVSKIGMPESRIILSEVVCFLALSPKSNSSYLAINNAIESIRNNGIQKVPYHLTHLGKSEYKYPFNYDNNYIDQKYMEKSIKFYNYQNNKTEKVYNEYMKIIKKEK